MLKFVLIALVVIVGLGSCAVVLGMALKPAAGSPASTPTPPASAPVSQELVYPWNPGPLGVAGFPMGVESLNISAGRCTLRIQRGISSADRVSLDVLLAWLGCATPSSK